MIRRDVAGSGKPRRSARAVVVSLAFAVVAIADGLLLPAQSLRG